MAWPSTAGSGTRQLLTASNRARPCASARSIATAHAPHSPSAQPSFVPVRPAARSHVSSDTSTLTASVSTSCPFRTKRSGIFRSQYSELSDDRRPRNGSPLDPLGDTLQLRKTANGMREIAQALLEVLHSGLRGALATVVSVSGSTPQRPGARLLLRPDGSIVGTVGGGALEHEIVESLKEAIRTGASRKITRDLRPELRM